MPTTGPVASEYALLLAALGRIWPACARSSRSSARLWPRRHDRPLSRVGGGALAADPPVQDDIVGTMLVWAIDIADWPLALELGDHVLAARLGLPERYKRGAAVLLAEVAESALRVAGRSARRARGDAGPHRRPRHARSGPRQAAQGHRPCLPGRSRSLRSRGRKPAGGGKRALVDAALTTPPARSNSTSAGVKKVVERLTADLKKLPEASATP
jgi:hypothetical protein